MNSNFEVILSGGLGNQLFQVSAGLYFSRNSGLTPNFVLAPNGFVPNMRYPEIRNLLNINIDEWPKKNSPYSGLGLRISRFLASHSTVISKFRKVFAPTEVGYVGELDQLAPNWRLIGYFQSFRYVDPIIDDIKNCTLDPISTPWAKDLREQLRCRMATSLHIRRGDYVSDSANFILLGRNYYLSAMEYIVEKTSSEEFIVFSDDPKMARDLLSGTNFSIKYVEPPIESPSRESLGLMWECKNHITANSTFSWWGSVLSGNQGLTVAPAKWMTKTQNPTELLPPTWNLIDSY